MKEYIDISVSVRPDLPVWEGDPPINIYPASSIEKGGMANVSRLDIGAHTGTHVDAPIHFVPGRRGIDELDLDTLIGPAFVADFTGVKREITERDLEAAGIPSGTVRLLCKTSNSQLWVDKPSAFDPDFVGISAGGARWLIENGVRLVGVDYLGVERFDSVARGAPTHHALLEEEIVIVEGLNLRGVAAGVYSLICLPVKIEHSDGAPCRAILVKE